MNKRNKKNMFAVYEKIIAWFDDNRNKDLAMEKAYLAYVQEHIPPGGSVLDVGCGTGEPIAKFFIDNGYQLTGLDASNKMIELCKQRFPNEHWILEDMRTVDLHKQFDVVIAWHSFFHLPHEDQRPTIKLLAAHIKPKGLFVFTSGPEHSEVWSDNGGHALYHASLSSEEYEDILRENNLQVRMHHIKDPSCGDATVWVAQKIL